MSTLSRAGLVLLLLTGCDGTLPAVDAGPDPRDDAAAPDRDAPRIIEATPDDGSIDVARGSTFEATFSEPMELGSVRVRVEGVQVAVDRRLEDDDTRLIIEPHGGEWPAASEVEVRIGADFEDRAGNPLDRAYVFRFLTADDITPVVVSAEPAEGTDGVSTRSSAIRIRFSKPMNQGAGTVTLEGGPGEIDADAPAWSPFEVSYAVRGLAHDTAYRVVLSGFRDRTGNALDPEPVLGDGAIDFTTRPDDEPPQVASSIPFEGQLDVLVERLEGIEVVFDEDMDTSVVTAALDVDGETSTVDVEWRDARTALVDIEGAASTDAPHSLDLRGMRDLAGNALATAPYLGDGHLDFTSGIDASAPFVASSTPEEGASDVANPLGDVVLSFSEAMDESFAEVTLTDDLARTTTATGTWRSAGTILVIPGSAFTPGRTYRVALRALRDLSGAAVSSAHPYLGDGVLDFSIARPTGESCAQPLMLEHADSVTAGRYAFEITRAQRVRQNGSAWCDDDGPADGLDSVIYYRKTTPALSDPSGAGRALRILTDRVTNRANVEVYAGICDPRDAGAPAARLLCVTGHGSWDQLLDLPAGDYYLWFSTSDGSAFDIDLMLEEVAAVPEGESCADPFDTSSSIYTAPATPGEPHVFSVPSTSHVSVDIAESNAPSMGISCRSPDSEGFGDVVVEYPKAADDTVLDLWVRGSGGTVTAEVISGACRATDPAAVRSGCIPSVTSSGSRRLTVEAPAGPTYIWLAGTSSSSTFAGANVEIREVPAPSVPGSSCATAIPITPGASVPITPDHAERYFGPSCVPVDSGVTWYAFDTVEEITQIHTTGTGAVALVNAADGREGSCSTDATETPLAIIAPAGTRVCVAVESGSSVSALSVDSLDYGGVGTSDPVRLFLERPTFEGTLYEGFSIGGDGWLALTPTQIWQNMGTAMIFGGPRAGSGRMVERPDTDGRVIGDDARALGEELFSLDLTGSGGRLFRFTDASGAWAPVVWDPGATYARNTRTFAADADWFYIADNISRTTSPRLSNIYRVSRHAPGAVSIVGALDTAYDIDQLVVDETYLYFTASDDDGTGFFRVRKDALTGAGPATPEIVVRIKDLTAVRLDAAVSPRYAYVRDVDGDIFVIESPAGSSPRILARIFEGDPDDEAMDYDPATGTLVFFSTLEDPEGDWYRFGPP